MFNQPVPLPSKYDLAAEALQSTASGAAYQMHRPDDGELANTLGMLRLVELAVDQARRQVVELMRLQGASWEQIGDALGVSRQAAHERFHR